ncbi:Ig-like domain-containing protein [Actinoplanes regularis]|uniref:Ig-like domain-containing protein n=1 Tax=Actinoplanes regularis TaxID=52697 RepID=UPI00249FB05B|nr:Ig-like domain-containing protein [Actinoplanes regularis]GLW35136.1 hypothetical protein Areg01_80720 [Actinoplanes regularis]
MARLRRGAVAVIAGSLALAAAAPAHADEPIPDTTAPVITSTGLTPGQQVGVFYDFEPIFSDNIGVQQIQVFVNGTLRSTNWLNPTWPGGARLIATGLPDGADLDVTVRVIDAAGNASEATTRVRLDAIVPHATLIPAGGTAMESGPVTITLTGLPDDIRDVTMVDTTTHDDLAVRTEAPWTFTWNATEQATRPLFELQDKAGNWTNLSSGYVVDDTAPVIDHVNYQAMYLPVQALKPGTGTTVGARAHLDATVTDKTPLSRVEWWVDGTLRGTRFTAFNIEPQMTKGSSSTVELRVWDALGHPATATFPLTIDRAGPTISNITPGNLTPVHGWAITSAITVTDPNGLGHTSIDGVDGSSRTMNVPLPHRDGPFTFTWTAIDRLGNQSSASRTVIVDNTAPSLAYSKAPKNGAKLTKTTAITATASDRNGITRVQLLVNSKLVTSDTRAGYAFTLNPKKYGKTFTVKLRAYDRAGNIRYTSQRTYHR